MCIALLISCSDITKLVLPPVSASNQTPAPKITETAENTGAVSTSEAKHSGELIIYSGWSYN